MRDIPLVMVRERMDHLPFHPCPDGYRLRSFAAGDEETWARIEAAAGAFPDASSARRQFEAEFGPHRHRLAGRCLFLEDATAGPIGTATAWDGRFDGETRGRVHWVGIVPSYQGRGLAKPLLSAVMARLAADYRRSYLTTETTSYRGINLYLGFGFAPWIVAERDREGRAIVERVLGRPILRRLDEKEHMF